MGKLFGMTACAAAAVLLLTGCQTESGPQNTSQGLNGLQERALTTRNIGEDLDATYNDVWFSTIATLQLNGFILKQADRNSGFIYGVWKDSYEKHNEYSTGNFLLTQLGTSNSWYGGVFYAKTSVYKQIEVSVTLEPLTQTQTLVRLVSRFDNEGVPTAHGVFANRFFGVLRKEIFLRKNGGSIYQKFSAN